MVGLQILHCAGISDFLAGGPPIGLMGSSSHESTSPWLYIGPSTLKPPVGSCPVGSLPLQPWVQPQPGRPANPRVHLSPSSSVLSDMWSCSQMPLWPQDAFCPHQVVPITEQQCDTNFSNRKKKLLTGITFIALQDFSYSLQILVRQQQHYVDSHLFSYLSPLS